MNGFAGHLVASGEPRPLRRGLPGPPTRLSDRNLLQIVDVAEAVRNEPAMAVDAVGYMARILIQTNLPHRDPGDVPAWTRRNGEFVLQITPGTTVGVVPVQRLGIPYGVYPRLILAYVTTEALRTRSPLIRLGHNLSETMERVGPFRCTGGERGTITRFKEQLARLSRAEIAWAFRENDKVLSAGIKPFEGMEAFWTVGEKRPFISELVLNNRLFDEILHSSVPLDMRVIRELVRQRSSLAIDLYGWLTYRQFFLQRSGKTVLVPWKELEGQFGGDYMRTRDFRRRLVSALKIVSVLYREANATPQNRGLFIKPGRPQITARSSSSESSEQPTGVPRCMMASAGVAPRR